MTLSSALYKNLIFLLAIAAVAAPACRAFKYRALYLQALSRSVSAPGVLRPPERLAPAKKLPDIPVQAPEYRSKYPDFYAPQELDASVCQEKTVYLTFDDGPSRHTYDILNALKEADVKATFFVVGLEDDYSKQAMRDIAAAGHTLAMHSYSHRYKVIYSSVEAYLDDMYKVFCLIKETTGVTPTHFRMAGGSVNSYDMHIYQEIIAEMLRRGFVPFDWNVSAEDASPTPPSRRQITENIARGAEKNSRAVVLMHDSPGKYTTVAALPRVIENLKNQGFDFKPLTPDTRPVLFSYPT